MTDAETFEAIYGEHVAEVRMAARAVLRDPALAEDIVQDVFERVWRGAGYDASRGPLGPYLRMLARSRALDLWRRTRAGERAQVRLEQGAGAASIAHEPESAVIRTTERRQARAAVRRLPPEQRQAIGLAYWAGLSAQEIATAERIPLGTAKSRVRLGLTKLSDDPSFAA